MNSEIRPYFFCFDLDGTLTSEELLPKIASFLQIEKEMSLLTAQAMAGDIPFEISLRKRVEMLKSIPVSTVQEIVSSVRLNSSVLQFIRENADRCVVITGNLDVWIAPLMEKIGIRYFSSTAECSNDRLMNLKTVLSKGSICKMLPRPLVAIGDGNNDVEMLKEAEIGIAFGGVHPPSSSLLDVASHAIYSERELCRFLRQLSLIARVKAPVWASDTLSV